MSLRFEHLEHIDDDLSWEGLQAAAQDAIKPSRLKWVCSKEQWGNCVFFVLFMWFVPNRELLHSMILFLMLKRFYKEAEPCCVDVCIFVNSKIYRWIYCTLFAHNKQLKAERHKQAVERFSTSEVPARFMFFSPPSSHRQFYGDLTGSHLKILIDQYVKPGNPHSMWALKGGAFLLANKKAFWRKLWIYIYINLGNL